MVGYTPVQMNVAAWVRGVLYRPLQGARLCLKGQLSGTNPISFPQTPIGLLSPLEAVCISRCGLRAGPSLGRLCAKHVGGTNEKEMGPALEGALVSEETGPQRAPHSSVCPPFPLLSPSRACQFFKIFPLSLCQKDLVFPSL